MCLTPIYVKGVGDVPCGKCVECKIQYSEQWASRIMLEAKKYEHNSFLSLTYSDTYLPEGASLKKRDFQLFMKRLRKQLNKRFAIKVRFFGCGEYGSEKGRPHYHIILFGFDFPDKYFWCYDNKGNPLYRSPFLEKIWSQGFSTCGDISFVTAKYCAKYMQADFRNIDKKIERPFTLMSRKPGIALDVIPDTVYKYGDVYIDGKRYLAPRAFLKKFKEKDEEEYNRVMSTKQGYYVQYKKGLLNVPVEYLDSYIKDKAIRLESRKKKYKNIFGKKLDNNFRPVVSFKTKDKPKDLSNEKWDDLFR